MIYLHVPFCRSFCTYCGFYSELVSCGKKDVDKYREYTNLVIDEIKARRQEILSSCFSCNNAQGVDTLYFGGGTPSSLPDELLFSIIDSINSLFPANHTFSEFTIEVNPEDIVEKGIDYVKALLSRGVNRISMGIQSFDDSILKWMNRRHNAERAELAFNILREAGVKNISIDLIFGIPALTMEGWNDTLQKALALDADHISAYQLSIDDNSALGEMLKQGRFQEADDEICRQQYELLCRSLKEKGYNHYEISNFAKPGKEAIHNSAYWKRVPYVGLGPGAHSLQGDRTRIANTESIPYTQEIENLSDYDIRVETIMLGLRTSIGVKNSYLYANCNNDVVNALLDRGLLEVVDNGYIRIPESNFFISDQIICELI